MIGCGNSTPTKIVADQNKTKPPAIPKESKKIKLSLPTNNQIYFGAFADFGGSEDIVTKEKIENFEKLVGKKTSWSYISQNWKNGITYPKRNIHIIHDSNTTPFVRLMPRSEEEIEGFEDGNFTMQRIIDGNFDKELKQWAKDAKTDNIPLLLDFGVEMNGFWFPWSGKNCGAGKLDGYGDPNYPDGPERFRDAYRHIIDIFKNEGANHITWFFHPDIQRLPDEEWNSAKYYYPGDDYIDWIGLSIYGVQFNNEEWIDFSESLRSQYIYVNEITDKKPIAILEFGVTDNRIDGSKSAWFEDAFSTILSNQYIKFSAVTYWHEDWINEDGSRSTLKVNSSKESLETFKRLIQNDRFISKTIWK
jgi:beta-mannanase